MKEAHDELLNYALGALAGMAVAAWMLTLFLFF